MNIDQENEEYARQDRAHKVRAGSPDPDADFPPDEPFVIIILGNGTDTEEMFAVYTDGEDDEDGGLAAGWYVLDTDDHGKLDWRVRIDGPLASEEEALDSAQAMLLDLYVRQHGLSKVQVDVLRTHIALYLEDVGPEHRTVDYVVDAMTEYVHESDDGPFVPTRTMVHNVYFDLALTEGFMELAKEVIDSLSLEAAAKQALNVKSWDELDVSEPCTVCGGELQVLGQLGPRTHIRCRNCGIDTSTAKDQS